MTTVLLLVLGAGLALLGLVGLLFPALPGAPLLFLGLVVAAWAEGFAYVGTGTLVLLAVLAALTYAIDIAAGILGARRFGASPRAMLGAAIGAVAGLFFGIAGVLLGPFVGACIGEFSHVREVARAGRAGLGAAVGLLLGMALKIAVAFSMIGIFAVARFG